jgi:hypothetical protein
MVFGNAPGRMRYFRTTRPLNAVPPGEFSRKSRYYWLLSLHDAIRNACHGCNFWGMLDRVGGFPACANRSGRHVA